MKRCIDQSLMDSHQSAGGAQLIQSGILQQTHTNHFNSHLETSRNALGEHEVGGIYYV